MQKLSTVRFGDIEYQEEDVIQLPDGLVGLPDLRRWLILEMGQDVPMLWLQSLDRGDFGFPVCQPELFLDEYKWDLTPSQDLKIRAGAPGQRVALIIATIAAGGTRITGNLLAPLVIDSTSRLGVQAPQAADNYSLKHEINYLKFGLAVSGPPSENADRNGQGKENIDSCPETVESQAEPVADKPKTVGV